MQLAINEFTSYEDYIGLFQSEPEPETFFSVQTLKTPPAFPKPKFGFTQPKAIIELLLSDQKFEYERKVYTLMTLIGDIGGFQGAIIILPAFLLSFYTPKMFEAQLLSEMPIKKRKKQRRVQQPQGDDYSLDKRL